MVLSSTPNPSTSLIGTGPTTLLLATRKGAFFLASNAERSTWNLSPPIMLGHIIYHLVLDPRDQRTLLMAAKTGHLGPTVFRSTDGGATWKEAARPPAFSQANVGEEARVVDHVFWLTPGHTSEPGVFYAGTSPQALFRSDDFGDTWISVSGFNDHPMRRQWCGGGQDGTPDGPKMHSICVDPRDANHLYIGMSSGGVFESRDRGNDWNPLNKGCAADFNPEPDPEFGHDPHCLVIHPARPDRLYQQNHCGIYRMERSEARWIRIGNNMPKDVGDIGFPMVPHPRNPDIVWVFPMDGSDVWPRTSPAGRPAVYGTTDAGASWNRLDNGLPQNSAYLTVKRQAMSADCHDPVGIYFGSTSGEVFGSVDEGNSWKSLCRHLPHIYAVEAVEWQL